MAFVLVKDYTVFNPNFADDVLKFMDLPYTIDKVERDIELANETHPLTSAQIESGKLTLKERLNFLIDRVEFIGHLGLVAQAADESGEILMGQEVRGIRSDIKSLQLYLALTCIDIFCERPPHREHFEEVFSNAPEPIRRRLENDLLLQKPDGTTGALKEMGLFFYNVRNYYTHSGRRFHIMDTPLDQLVTFKSGTRQNKEDLQLIVTKEAKPVDLIVSLALYVAKQRFGWATD